MLQNEYLVAIVAVHTAENEPSKVYLHLSVFRYYLVLSIASARTLQLAGTLDVAAGIEFLRTALRADLLFASGAPLA